MFRVVEENSCEMKAFENLDDAIYSVGRHVKKETHDAYENDMIDKYAVEDILWDIETRIKNDMGFEHPDLENISYTINEFDEKPLIEELKKLGGEFDCTLNKDYKDLEIDEWGIACIWIKKLGIRVEYNFCIDDGDNYSGIYLTKFNKELDFIEADYDVDIHYEIDFDDNEWEKKLENKMWIALIELGNL